MITSSLVASVTMGDATKKFDIGLPFTDVGTLSDEEIIEAGKAMGEAYGKLLIRAKENKL